MFSRKKERIRNMTWALTKAAERALGLFYRKILSSIFGAVQDKGQWRWRYNFEFYKLYDEPDLVKYIKINSLKWVGHVMQMDSNRITKIMFRAVFWVVLPCKMIVDHHFTRQYNPEDSSEHHTCRRENLKSHN
jgi:hypothetical protein